MATNVISLSGLIGIVLVVAIIAATAGWALCDSDLLNYNTSAAAARAQDQKTQEQTQRAAIDLQYYEAIQATRIQAEQEKLRLELEARQRELDQNLAYQHKRTERELELARLTRYVLLAVGSLAILIMSIGPTVFLIQHSHSRSLVARAEAEAAQTALWHIPAWRVEQIRRAREREIRERETAMGQQAIERSATGGNGRNAPRNQPTECTKRQVA
ncbi:MAG: hypothetical protein AMJ93_11885 [Anaerolineae bacterium SM23_84]|nr:MAG: hypothetical protein AMJ93_11885 [Anaerolineae bacterium SM23_84]